MHFESADKLSNAEREVFDWLVVGKSNWEIAQILGKSVWTVKNQIKMIYSKLGVNNRASAIHCFFQSATTGTE